MTAPVPAEEAVPAGVFDIDPVRFVDWVDGDSIEIAETTAQPLPATEEPLPQPPVVGEEEG